MFLNSGRAGTAGDTVVGLEVVIADGRRIVTGSAAIKGGAPFFRNHGPDLTGLFLNDAGAMGVKASATLRLERIPEGIAFATFGFKTFPDMIDGALAVGRTGLAAECLGLAAHPVPSATDAPGRPTLHVVTEGATQTVADIHYAKLAEAIGQQATPAPAVVPKFIRDDPFGFLTAPLDAGGRRQIWTHGIFPFDRAATGYAAVAALLDQHREQLARHHIDATVTIAISMNAALIEPVLTWPDAPTPLHLRGMGIPPTARHPDNPIATAVVSELRDQLRDLYARLGAAHLQLGKYYAFSKTVAPEAHGLIRALKHVVDPTNLLNPGALDLS
jgi:FAD/FMN-containing dehydrogenase